MYISSKAHFTKSFIKVDYQKKNYPKIQTNLKVIMAKPCILKFRTFRKHEINSQT